MRPKRGKRMSSKSTLGERVAVLESEVAHVRARLESNTVILGNIDAKLTKQKGFVAGMVFVFTAIWGVIITAVQYFPFKP